jgi:hypothetical protein
MTDIAQLVDEEILVLSGGGGQIVIEGGNSSVGIAEMGATGNVEMRIPNAIPTVVYIGGGEALSAKVLIVEKIARHNFSALRMMVLPTATECEYGQPTSYNGAKVAGMSVNAGLAGATCKILLFGQFQDPFFNFTAQAPLFLGTDGAITDVAPVVPFASHQVTIGQSLGSGSVLINISEPVAI